MSALVDLQERINLKREEIGTISDQDIVLPVMVDEFTFLVPCSDIRRIVLKEGLDTMPHAPSFQAGIIHAGGVIYSVVDLRAILGRGAMILRSNLFKVVCMETEDPLAFVAHRLLAPRPASDFDRLAIGDIHVPSLATDRTNHSKFFFTSAERIDALVNKK